MTAYAAAQVSMILKSVNTCISNAFKCFNSQSSQYTTFPRRCTSEINPKGLYTDANFLRISRLVRLALLLGISMAIESSFLSHNKPRIFISDS